MGKITTSLKSNTILETAVALVIIFAIFGIATVFFVRITATSITTTKLRAIQALKAYAENTEDQRLFFNDRQTIGDFSVKRIIKATGDFPNLWQIHYCIYDSHDNLLSDWQTFAMK